MLIYGLMQILHAVLLLNRYVIECTKIRNPIAKNAIQTIIWTKDGLMYWRIYASHVLNIESKFHLGRRLPGYTSYMVERMPWIRLTGPDKGGGGGGGGGAKHQQQLYWLNSPGYIPI